MSNAGSKAIFRRNQSIFSTEYWFDETTFDLLSGDIVVVWKLDRLGRSLKHLVETVNLLLLHDVGIKSLNDPIDTTTPQGRLVFNLFASLAEFERDVIRERTQLVFPQLALVDAQGDVRKDCRNKPNPPLAPPKHCTVKASSAHRKLSNTCIFPRALYTLISAIEASPLAYRGQFDRAVTCPVPRKIIPSETLIDLARRMAMLPARSHERRLVTKHWYQTLVPGLSLKHWYQVFLCANNIGSAYCEYQLNTGAKQEFIAGILYHRLMIKKTKQRKKYV